MNPTTKDYSYVYTLADPTTGLVRYVGQSVDVKKRLGLHLFYAKRNSKKTHKEKWLARMVGLGLKPITEIVWEGSKSIVSQKEMEFIKLFKSFGARLTNATDGGETTIGRKCSEETKEKFRKMFTGKCLRSPISPQERAATSIRSKGKRHSEETIARLKTERAIGSSYWSKNEAAYNNMLRFCERGKSLAKKIVAIKDGRETVYSSTIEAERETRCDRKSIRMVANGVYSQTKGYVFKFLYDETVQGLSKQN